ncbi:SRPBCC family protein [Hyalangium gracile]|uniref:SRPBCC family protein n=1 Tax=Hyalangium gracile TaxID=394092 RepID=UPI001CC94876|nr:SRPBCC domain-containing protein [Hyalangium gracile]
MTVKKEASGRRSVQVEVEVPGTPEQVWEAIATGPGISAWFVPSEVEGRVGGAVVSHFGPGMDAKATVTVWEAPHRFVAEGEAMGPNAPSIATEWIVEARSGDTCVVRVVHSLFASTDDWDDQLNSIEAGWPGFFRILRLYLAHFRGQPCSILSLMGTSPEALAEAWEKLTGPLGLANAAQGQRTSALPEAPPLAGSVESVETNPQIRGLVLRIDSPALGVATLGAFPMGEQVQIVVQLYLYGEQAPAAVARAEPAWRAWMNSRFPMIMGGLAC